MSTATREPKPTATEPVAGRRVLMAVAAALVAALGVGLFLAARSTADYPDGSPEAAAQGYLQALFDHDPEAARSYLAPEFANRCDIDDPSSWWIWSTDAVTFDAVRTDGDVAEIDVRLTSVDNYDVFDIPIDRRHDWSHTGTITLNSRDGQWLIVDTSTSLHQCHER